MTRTNSIRRTDRPQPLKAHPARDARIAAFVTTVGEQLGPEYKAALEAYAAAKGVSWPQLLALDWYDGKDEYFRDKDGQPLGGLLRQIRNHPDHGPAFYRALTPG